MSTAPANTLAAPSDEQVLGWLRTMLLIRRFEERAEQLTVRGKIPAEFTRRWAKKQLPWGWRQRSLPEIRCLLRTVAIITPWPRACRLQG